jgi:hypothetical protein
MGHSLINQPVSMQAQKQNQRKERAGWGFLQINAFLALKDFNRLI